MNGDERKEIGAPDRNFMWRVIEREGGRADVAGDRGGLTNRGITRSLYRAYCAKLGVAPSRRAFEAMDDDLAQAVYEAMFIRPLRIDDLKSDLIREAVFGAAIHHGGPRAIRFAQGVAGGLKVDGLIGPMTIERLNTSPAVAFANGMAARRILFTDRLVQRTAARGDYSQIQFLYGWHRRMLGLIQPRID